MTGRLVGVGMLFVVPFLVKTFVPVIGEPLWRAYWQLVRWILLAPCRMLAFVVRQAGRRQ